MGYLVENRVLESTTTTGTGPLTLAGAVTSFRRFSAVCAIGDTVPYFIEALDSLGVPSGDYEYGIGTYTSANVLTRTTIQGSSNGGAAVNFAAGTKNVGLAPNKADWDAKAPLASPAFTGAPTAPTQLGSDDSTKLATTGWVRAAMASIASAAGFQVFLGGSGYVKLPSWLGGVVIQWGLDAGGAGDHNINYPLAFPTAARVVTATMQRTGTELLSVAVSNVGSPTFFSVYPRYLPLDGSPGGIASQPIFWIAVGH